MNRNIQDYVQVYENFLDKKYCKKTIKSLKDVEWKTHQFYEAGTGEYKSYENELSVSWDNIKERKEIQDKLWNALQSYITDLPKFSKSNSHLWYNGWNGYSELRFNKYDKTTQMKLHCDHIHTMFDGQRKGIPTLSILGVLNDDYEGGDLIMWDEEKIDLKGGSLLIFPSNFLYPHEVKPVKKGSRYSYVSWAW
jgi:predicted 2-oxoglutarate/Fe(II)-dependent dioxygenase YbiX